MIEDPSPPSSPGSEEQQRLVASYRQAVYFAGPYPPPDLAERYEKMMPGFLERSFAIFEEQSAHRRQIETKAQNSNHQSDIYGKTCATVVLLAALIGAVLLGLHGEWGGGVTLFGLDVTATVIALFATTRQQDHRMTMNRDAFERGLGANNPTHSTDGP